MADSHSKNLLTAIKPKDFAPTSHPLRPIRQQVNALLTKIGSQRRTKPMPMAIRPDIASEKLMHAMQLHGVRHSVCSKR